MILVYGSAQRGDEAGAVSGGFGSLHPVRDRGNNSAMNERLQGPTRYVVLFIAIVLAGWIGAKAAGVAVASNGALASSILQSESPSSAALAILGYLVVGTLMAGAVGRLTNAAVGLFVLGCGLYAVAFRSGTIEDLAFGGQGLLPLVAIETLLWALALALASAVVFLIAGPLQDMKPELGDTSRSIWSPTGLSSPALGTIVLVGVVLIARSHGKGQTIMAVLIGSMAAGMVARALRPRIQPILLFASPCLFGAVGHLIGWKMVSKPLDEAFVDRDLWSLSLAMPADYAAGSLLGVSLGLGWAKSFMHPESDSFGAELAGGAPKQSA